MSPQNTLHIGVLIPEEVQLLDLASVDLFSLLAKSYLQRCALPDEIVSQGLDEIKFHYIHTEPHQSTTAGADIRITNNIDDREIAPGSLDIILIPGPFPPATTSEAVKNWVQAHLAKGTTFLVVCTGSYVAGNCGLFDGKLATGPLPFEANLRELYPKANWSFTRRWVRDGNVWSSGTIVNGLDMVAAYIKETYPPVLADLIDLAEVAERPVEYA